jgi:hypothetical protein
MFDSRPISPKLGRVASSLCSIHSMMHHATLGQMLAAGVSKLKVALWIVWNITAAVRKSTTGTNSRAA